MKCNKPSVGMIFLAAAGLLAGSVFFMYWVGHITIQSAATVDAQRSIIHELDQSLSTLKDAETGQRGYLLTGQEPYLEPYKKAVAQVQGHLDGLRHLVSTGDLPAESVGRVAALTDEKLVELEQTIQLRRDRGLEAALVIMQSGQDKRIMDSIRSEVAEMRAGEEAELQQAARRAYQATVLRTVTFILTGLLNLVFLGWAYRRIQRDITERKQATEALRQSEERYHMLFDTLIEGFCIIEVLFDPDGKPVDYRFLEINAAFEARTGLRNARGKRMRELAPDHEEYWFHIYGKVALTGEPARFVNEAKALGRWYDVSAYRVGDPESRKVAILFNDITERKQAEQQAQRLLSAVQQEKDRLASVLGSITDEVWFADTDRKFTLANPSATREFLLGSGDGIDVEKLAGDLEVYRSDGSPRPVHEAPPLRALAGEVIRGEEEIVRTPGSGQLRHRQVSASPVRDASGKIIGSVSVVRDITDSKRAQEALRQSREQLDLALISSRMATFDWDIIHNKRTWSDGVHSLLGTRPETFTGTPEEFFQVIHPEDRGTVQAALARAVETTGVYETEYRAVWPDGNIHHIAARGKIHRDQTGQAVLMTGVCWDITARKQAEEHLRESEARYRSLFENMLDGFAYCQMLFDEQDRPRDFVYLEVNDAFGRLTGLKNVIGKKVTEVIPGIRESDPELFEVYGRVARTGKPERFEIELTPLHMWLSVSVYGPGSGYFVAVFDNITARKRAERELRELNETLEKRVAERTAVAQVRAEQLRMLAQELTQAEQRERQRIAHILHEHFQQLLVAAKFSLSMVQVKDADSQESLQRTDQVLAEAVEASRSLAIELSPPILRYGGLGPALGWLGQWMLEKHGLTVEVVAEPQAPMPDEDVQILLFEAVRELLFNVVKHAKVDQARVELKQEAGRLLRLTVSDKGAGFHTDRFLAKACTPGGFGLFSIRERLSFLQGHVEICSAPGDGTCISLLVPLLPATQAGATADRATFEAPATAPAERQDATAGPPTTPGPNGSKIKVLIADDHAIVRDGLSRLLQALPDIDVVGQAEDGRQAVDLALQLRPDVAVMDVSMPELNGIEATRYILADLPNTRIIGLSMHTDEDMAKQMQQAGAAAYLAKTGPADRLVAAIRKCAARSAVAE